MNQVLSGADRVTTLADSIFNAELSRTPVKPLTDIFPDLTLQDAYRIQRINIDRRIKSGAVILGHKVGLTARAMQEKFGVNEPDYGHLLDTMFHDAGSPLDMNKLIDPQIEVEPAFILAKRIMGPNLSAADVLEATDYVSICFEVIDSRIIDWRVKIQDTVADNGSSALVILGSKKIKASDLILDNLETILEIDGTVVETGNTSAILGHPANGVAWLANKISEFGVALEAGHVVLPGTCTRSCRISGHKRVLGRIESLGDIMLDLTGVPAVINNNE